MDIKKILEQQNQEYQLIVARSILSFSRADAATQAQLLDSYRALIQEYEEFRKEIQADESLEIRREIQAEDEMDDYEKREQEQNQGMNMEELDQYLDDPRHGQAEPLNRGDF